MEKKTWIILLIVFAVLLALWIATELIIPRVANSYIRNVITKRYPEATDVEVTVRAFPALRLLFKQYSTLKLQASDITLEDVHFETIELTSSSRPGGEFKAMVEEDELIRVFSPTAPYLMDPLVSLAGDTIRITGTVDVGYAKVKADVTGHLEPRGGRELYFVPRSIDVSGTPLPDKAIEAIQKRLNQDPVYVVREDLPLTVATVQVEQGKLSFTGRVDIEEALDVEGL